jgi:molybdate transport system substrate-binding protein
MASRAGTEGCSLATRWGRSVSCVAILAGAILLVALQGRATAAGDPVVRVAVAASFSQTAERLCRSYFAGRSGRCVLTPGSSGLLASQVAQGAPFDLFLSADRRRAERLEVEGLAVPGSRFTYAIGQLVLWAPALGGEDLETILRGDSLATLAIANPASAPYGAAALETLRSLGIDPAGRIRIVQGTDATQAFQFVASGAADAGFVARSQVLEYQASSGASIAHAVVAVDPALHAPIEQQAVLLARAAANADARGLLEFLRSDAAGRIILAAGYALPPR